MRWTAALILRPVTFVVGYSAGGSPDINARELAQVMTPVIGQQIIIDNKGGAAGSIGLRAVANASAIALLLGIICVGGRFIGLANIAYFLSDTVVTGFKTGAAFYIAHASAPPAKPRAVAKPERCVSTCRTVMSPLPPPANSGQ